MSKKRRRGWDHYGKRKRRLRTYENFTLNDLQRSIEEQYRSYFTRILERRKPLANQMGIWDDMYQECWVAYAYNIYLWGRDNNDEYEPIRFKSYIRNAIQNAICDCLREARWRWSNEVSFDEVPDASSICGARSDNYYVIERSADLELLDKAVKEQPSKQVKNGYQFTIMTAEGYSPKEIAEHFGESHTSVRQCQYRYRQWRDDFLREHGLAEDESGSDDS